MLLPSSGGVYSVQVCMYAITRRAPSEAARLVLIFGTKSPGVGVGVGVGWEGEFAPRAGAGASRHTSSPRAMSTLNVIARWNREEGMSPVSVSVP